MPYEYENYFLIVRDLAVLIIIQMDDLINDFDFEYETNNNFIDEESEPEIISDAEENNDSNEKDDEKWREKLDRTEPSNSFLRYFDYKKGDEYAKCRMCHNRLARKQGNTNGMKKHLKARHGNAFKEFEAKESKKRSATSSPTKPPPKKQTKLEFRPIEKWASNHPKSLEIDEKILRFICLSLQPLLLSEKNGFSDMIEALNPRFFLNVTALFYDLICLLSYKLKSRHFFTRKLEQKYFERFNEIKLQLQDAAHISFTTDGWKSKNGKKKFIRFLYSLFLFFQ